MSTAIEGRLEPFVPHALAALRIVSGYLFLLHGTAKLFGFPHVAMFDALPVWSLLGVAGMLEVAGGALLILGAFTRSVAFVVSGEMAFAYFLVHAPSGNVLTPMLNDGEPAVLYCFVFLLLSVVGGGSWSIDAARRGATRPPEARPAPLRPCRR
ncbi:MAG TPA: DoxX family protein [Caldimonas sp.]|nr:DoxX family protein [Caldimonas sp.]